MIKYSVVFISALLPFTTNAYTMKNTAPIKYCGDAVISNNKAKKWELFQKPETDKAYYSFINSSPWCSVTESDKPNHKKIMHYSSLGVPSEIQIHKSGERTWINKNWRTLKKKCVVPYDLYNTIYIAKGLYRKPKDGHSKWCAIFGKMNQSGNYRMHQHGLGKLMKGLGNARKRR